MVEVLSFYYSNAVKIISVSKSMTCINGDEKSRKEKLKSNSYYFMFLDLGSYFILYHFKDFYF